MNQNWKEKACMLNFEWQMMSMKSTQLRCHLIKSHGLLSVYHDMLCISLSTVLPIRVGSETKEKMSDKSNSAGTSYRSDTSYLASGNGLKRNKKQSMAKKRSQFFNEVDDQGKQGDTEEKRLKQRRLKKMSTVDFRVEEKKDEKKISTPLFQNKVSRNLHRQATGQFATTGLGPSGLINQNRMQSNLLLNTKALKVSRMNSMLTKEIIFTPKSRAGESELGFASLAKAQTSQIPNENLQISRKMSFQAQFKSNRSKLAKSKPRIDGSQLKSKVQHNQSVQELQSSWSSKDENSDLVQKGLANIGSQTTKVAQLFQKPQPRHHQSEDNLDDIITSMVRNIPQSKLKRMQTIDLEAMDRFYQIGDTAAQYKKLKQFQEEKEMAQLEKRKLSQGSLAGSIVEAGIEERDDEGDSNLEKSIKTYQLTWRSALSPTEIQEIIKESTMKSQNCPKSSRMASNFTPSEGEKQHLTDDQEVDAIFEYYRLNKQKIDNQIQPISQSLPLSPGQNKDKTETKRLAPRIASQQSFHNVIEEEVSQDFQSQEPRQQSFSKSVSCKDDSQIHGTKSSQKSFSINNQICLEKKPSATSDHNASAQQRSMSGNLQLPNKDGDVMIGSGKTAQSRQSSTSAHVVSLSLQSSKSQTQVNNQKFLSPKSRLSQKTHQSGHIDSCSNEESKIGSEHQNLNYLLENVFLRKEAERSSRDYRSMHQYFMDNCPKMRDIYENNFDKKYSEMKRLYQNLKIKMYNAKDYLCQYGEKGDRFFIILKGTVVVLIPREVELTFPSIFEVYQFIMEVRDRIRSFKNDAISKFVFDIIQLFTPAVLLQQNFLTADDMLQFLKEVIGFDPKIQERLGIPLDVFRRIKASFSFIKDMIKHLEDVGINPDLRQTRITSNEKSKSYFRRRSTLKNPNSDYFVNIELLEQVNELSDGVQFGEESLISERPRNATIFVKSEKIITAILTAHDFRALIGESERRKMDEKIKLIMQFDLMQGIPRNKLKNLYKLFFTKDQYQKPYEAHRNQYLFRQGEPINGVFFLLSGEVSRIRENWSMQKDYRGDSLQVSNSQAESFRTHDMSNSDFELAHFGTLNQIRRKFAEQVVLSQISGHKVIGMDEILLNQPNRNFTIKVSSEKISYLKLTEKEYRDKILKLMTEKTKHSECEKLATEQKLNTDWERKKFEFLRNNRAVQSQGLFFNQSNQGGLLSESAIQAEGRIKLKQIVKNVARKNTQNTELAPVPVNNVSSVKNRTKQAEKLSVVESMEEKNLDRFSTKLEKLEYLIDQEIKKKDVDMPHLVDLMRQKREENGNQLRIANNQRNREKIANLTSVSPIGRMKESELCLRFLRHEKEAQRIRKREKSGGKDKKSAEKQQEKQLTSGRDSKKQGLFLNADRLTASLVQGSNMFMSKWKHEKEDDARIQTILDSMTSDIRIQRSLAQNFRGRLEEFIEWINGKNIKYKIQLDVPIFAGTVITELPEYWLEQGLLEEEDNSPNRSKNMNSPLRRMKTKSQDMDGLSPSSLRMKLNKYIKSKFGHKKAQSFGRSPRTTHTPNFKGDSNKADIVKIFFEWFAQHPVKQTEVRRQKTSQTNQKQSEMQDSSQNMQNMLTQSIQKLVEKAKTIVHETSMTKFKRQMSAKQQPENPMIKCLPLKQFQSQPVLLEKETKQSNVKYVKDGMTAIPEFHLKPMYSESFFDKQESDEGTIKSLIERKETQSSLMTAKLEKNSSVQLDEDPSKSNGQNVQLKKWLSGRSRSNFDQNGGTLGFKNFEFLGVHETVIPEEQHISSIINDDSLQLSTKENICARTSQKKEPISKETENVKIEVNYDIQNNIFDANNMQRDRSETLKLIPQASVDSINLSRNTINHKDQGHSTIIQVINEESQPRLSYNTSQPSQPFENIKDLPAHDLNEQTSMISKSLGSPTFIRKPKQIENGISSQASPDLRNVSIHTAAILDEKQQTPRISFDQQRTTLLRQSGARKEVYSSQPMIRLKKTKEKAQEIHNIIEHIQETNTKDSKSRRALSSRGNLGINQDAQTTAFAQSTSTFKSVPNHQVAHLTDHQEIRNIQIQTRNRPASTIRSKNGRVVKGLSSQKGKSREKEAWKSPLLEHHTKVQNARQMLLEMAKDFNHASRASKVAHQIKLNQIQSSSTFGRSQSTQAFLSIQSGPVIKQQTRNKFQIPAQSQRNFNEGLYSSKSVSVMQKFVPTLKSRTPAAGISRETMARAQMLDFDLLQSVTSNPEAIPPQIRIKEANFVKQLQQQFQSENTQQQQEVYQKDAKDWIARQLSTILIQSQPQPKDFIPSSRIVSASKQTQNSMKKPQDFIKFTDRMIQDLQRKAKITSSFALFSADPSSAKTTRVPPPVLIGGQKKPEHMYHLNVRKKMRIDKSGNGTKEGLVVSTVRNSNSYFTNSREHGQIMTARAQTASGYLEGGISQDQQQQLFSPEQPSSSHHNSKLLQRLQHSTPFKEIK